MASKVMSVDCETQRRSRLSSKRKRSEFVKSTRRLSEAIILSRTMLTGLWIRSKLTRLLKVRLSDHRQLQVWRVAALPDWPKRLSEKRCSLGRSSHRSSASKAVQAGLAWRARKAPAARSLWRAWKSASAMLAMSNSEVFGPSDIHGHSWRFDSGNHTRH